MISLFRGTTPRDTVLATNGDYVIDRLVAKDKIIEELDGNFTYEATIVIDKSEPSELYNLLSKGTIVKVEDEYGDEIFRIASVQKSKRYINIFARQITIEDTLALWLDDVRPENKNGQGALQWILNNAKGVKDIFVSSDIKTISTAYYVDKNMYEAITSNDNAFLERWGGEIKRKQYNLSINERVGRNTGVQIASRKNLKGFDIKESETVITGIKAKGFDGIGDTIIYSPLRDHYPRTYIKEIRYEDVRLKTEDYPDGFETLEQAQAELIKRAKLEYSKNNIDKIQAEYNIDFIELSKTEEYKDVQATEKVEIGDTVNVKIDTFNLDINVRCIKREYSPKLKRRLSTKLSTKDIKVKPPQVSDIIAELEKNQQEGFQGLSGYINSMLNSGFKDSYYISRPNEALWLDNSDINLAKNVVRINKNGIGFSQTGYYGKYEYGFTIDGKINASLIAVGVLTAILIQSEDGSCTINLATGEVNFNKGRIKGLNSEWDLQSGQFKTSSVIGNELVEIIIGNGQITSSERLNIFGTEWVNLGIKRDSKVIKGLQINEYFTSFVDDEKSLVLRGKDGIGVQSNMIINSDLQVLGNKNCIQVTDNFGKIPFYANEDINSLLTKTSIDEWHETQSTEDGTYKCIVKIPLYLRECINTDMDYIVWIDKKGFGDYYYNTYPGYFVVISDKPLKFRYKLEGRRKNFEAKGEKTLML